MCQLGFQPGLHSARKVSPFQAKHRNTVRLVNTNATYASVDLQLFFSFSDLSRNEFTSLPTQLLSGLPNLKEINFEQNQITAVEDKTLENNSKLEKM